MDEKTLNALVNAIKNKDPKGLKAYENLQKIASSKPKNEEEQKNIEAAKGYVAEIKKRLTTKAAHGAKLDYVKSLKHICPEGQELVYFKKGGSVKCGCVGKKLEKGDKVEASGAVARFKKGIKISAKPMGSSDNSDSIVNAISTITQTKAGFDRAKKEKNENNKRKPVTNVATQDKNPGSTKQPMQEAQERARHKNDYNNLKKGGAVDKFKSAKCGSKMKKHQNGGLIQKSHILDRVFPQSIVK